MNNLIGAGELLRKSWELYWTNFIPLMRVAAWLLIPAAAMALLGVIPGTFAVMTGILSLAVFAASVIVGLWVNVCLIQATAKIYLAEKLEMAPIYNQSWNKIWPFLWVSILTGLFVFFGMLLLIIPGIIFSVWYAFATYANVLENTRGRAALSQSKALVSGKWWSVCWRFLAVYFIYGFVVSAVAWILIAIIAFATGQTHNLANSEIMAWSQNIIGNLINVAATPLFVVVGTILYLELKKLKGLKAVS
jgi:hypothetical protein